MPRLPNRPARLPSPAVVIAALALVIALGSTALAVVPAGKGTVSGSDLKKRSEPGNRFTEDTITGAEVNESKLGKLNAAVHADQATGADHAVTAATATTALDATKIGGRTAASLAVGCPGATALAGGLCIETGPARAPLTYFAAAQACGAIGKTVPSADQLTSFSSTFGGAGPEMSSDVFSTGANPPFITVDMTTDAQSSSNAATPYRCGAPPRNG